MILCLHIFILDMYSNLHVPQDLGGIVYTINIYVHMCNLVYLIYLSSFHGHFLNQHNIVNQIYNVNIFQEKENKSNLLQRDDGNHFSTYNYHVWIMYHNGLRREQLQTVLKIAEEPVHGVVNPLLFKTYQGMFYLVLKL